MREIIERLEALLDKERNTTANDNFVAWNGEEILTALRAGQALADELRRVEAALSASGYVLTAKRNAAQTALLAAFSGEETTG